MIFFDTNILVYYTINQDEAKQKISKKLIRDNIEAGTFCISPLIIVEYIFVLSKLKIIEEHKDKVEFFKRFSIHDIDIEIVGEAFKICNAENYCKNINDIIHLKTAQKNCTKLLTFDSDFKKLQKYTDIELEIIDV